MSKFLKKYSRIIYIILAIICIVIAYTKNQIFLYPTGVILLLLGLGILKADDNKDEDSENNEKE